MRTQRWQDWTIVLLGAWLVVSPFIGIGAISDAAAINSYLIGTAVVLFSFAAIAGPELWKEYTNMTLGLWLIAAPFVLGFASQPGPMGNQIIVGLLVASIALGVTLDKTTPTEGHGPHGHGHT